MYVEAHILNKEKKIIFLLLGRYFLRGCKGREERDKNSPFRGSKGYQAQKDDQNLLFRASHSVLSTSVILTHFILPTTNHFMR